MSSLTEVVTGRMFLLFCAWQVRMESWSALVRFVMVRRLVTLYSDTSSDMSSAVSLSLHQVTSGLGYPPNTSQAMVTDCPSI